MLRSSSDYLQALRKGHYVLFLEWPRFIVAQYKQRSTSSEGLGADNIVDLLIFEWLNNGFCEADAKAIALLSRLNEISPNPLSPDLSYAVVTLSIAVLQCMIYESTNSYLQWITSVPKTAKEVVALMNANSISPSLLNHSLPEQQRKFEAWASSVTDKEVAKVLVQIDPILKLRRDIAAYVDLLEKSDCIKNAKDDDKLDAPRLSVARRLLQYINEQVDMSERVQLKINEYVASIRELSPQPFEESILAKLSPPSIADNTWRLIANVGYFFSSLALPAEKEGRVSETPKPK